MKRAIVQPADMTGAALDELKQWLGITRNTEDGLLIRLLHSSLDLCEAFTGSVPIEATIEERHAISRKWFVLGSRPVRAITAIETVGDDGTRTPIDGAGYEIDISAESIGHAHITGTSADDTVVVTFIAGLSQDWGSLPEALKHGIIRLAAHHYLSRDAADPGTAPASIAALWRPWKQVRLA